MTLDDLYPIKPVKLVSLRYFSGAVVAIIEFTNGDRLYDKTGINSLKSKYADDGAAQGLFSEIIAKMNACDPHSLPDVSFDDFSGQQGLF